MVGPPFEELNCFGAMKLRIQWRMAESSPARVRIFSLPVPVVLGRFIARQGKSFRTAQGETNT
jgi:hypothetical protein